VRSGGVLRVTTIGCAVLAAAIVVAAALAGHAGFGIGLAAGLLVGSLNGYVIQGMLERRTPFRIASLGRLIGFSSLVLVAVLIFGTQAWTLPLGIGLAQRPRSEFVLSSKVGRLLYDGGEVHRDDGEGGFDMETSMRRRLTYGPLPSWSAKADHPRVCPSHARCLT